MFGDHMGDIVETLLLPFFFLGTGLQTAIWQSHIGMDAVGVIALVFVVAVGVKILGPIIAGHACGYSWPEAANLGILLNTRGLTELIVLNIGLSLGLISGGLFVVLVLMTVIATALTCPLLSLAESVSARAGAAAVSRLS